MALTGPKVEYLDIEQARQADLEVPDVYYAPQYAASAESIDGGRWECAVAEDGRYVFPYVRREIDASPGEYDLVTPYGYGGVVAPDAEGRRCFLRSFREVSRHRGLVAEFLRGNPFDLADPEADGLLVDAWRAHPTFAVVPGPGGMDEYWTACEGRHRTAVRKAEKSGVQVSAVDPRTLEDATSGFRALYGETMDRIGSSKRLKLPDAYYRDLNDGLGDAVTVLEARLGGERVAASIFLRWGDRLHYHLSGSTSEGMRVGATNAVLDHAIRGLLPTNGRLHLGGGVHEGDGLEKFKRSVSNVRTTVFLCRTVVDRQRYNDLVAASGADPDSGYFPAYRG